MADVTFEGQEAMVAALQRIASNVETQAGTIFAARVAGEITSREKVSQRKPLEVSAEGLEVTVAWPYPHEGGEGTYVMRIVNAAGRLMVSPLARDLGTLLEP